MIRVVFGNTPNAFVRTADGDAYEMVLSGRNGRTATVHLAGPDVAAGGDQLLAAIAVALDSALVQLASEA